MLRLIAMRHAHSPQRPEGDHARPLDDCGVREAEAVGATLARRGWSPDRVLASDAQRTRHTWDRMQIHIVGERPIELYRKFYSHGANAVLEQVATGGYADQTLLVLGHNPEWERLIASLSGQRVVMTPATAALLVTDAPTWAQAVAGPGHFRLHDLVRPSELDGQG